MPQEKGLLKTQNKNKIRLIGQLFDTYWLMEYEEQLYIMDQHAAHEKVMFERLMRDWENKEHSTQMISPPLVLTLSMQEMQLLQTYEEQFRLLGFEFEQFGGKEYTISGVPQNLYSLNQKELFLEMLDHLSDLNEKQPSRLILEKIASMSCKAAVKGNQRLSADEALALLEELMTLENPYQCPHGRPTLITMTKYELEKKFKRIV
jgi:DNA mismatch repair protein MutL